MPVALHVYMSHCTTTTVIYIKKPHYCTYKSKKNKNNLHQVLHTLLPNMCQKEMCPSSATYMPHIQISLHENMRQICQYISYMNLMQLTV